MEKSFGFIENGCAPFDDLLIYPFLSSYEERDKIISILIGKDVEVDDLCPVNMDFLAGKMAMGLEIEAHNEEERHFLYMVRIHDDYPMDAFRNIFLYTFGILAGIKQDDMDLNTSLLLILDADIPDRPLILRTIFDNRLVEGETNIVLVFTKSNTSGPLKDMIDELCNGKRDIEHHKRIRQGLEWVISKEGREEYKDYWDNTERRWKANLAEELIIAGINESEVKMILEMDDQDLSAYYELRNDKEELNAMIKD